MAHPPKGHDDFAAWHEADWQRLAQRQREWLPLADACWTLAGVRPGAKVADIGCGPGVLSARYAQLGGDVTAVDRSDEALMHIPAVAGLRPLRHDASRGPLPGSPYDVLFLTDVLHHVPAPALLLRHLRASGPMLMVSESAAGSNGHGGDGPRVASARVVAMLAGAGWRPGPVVADQPFGHYSIVAR